MLATVYMITHPSKPGDVYIGQTTNLVVRWRTHRSAARTKKGKLYNWWRKRESYGVSPVIATIEVFETSCPMEAKLWLNDVERQYVALMRSWVAGGVGYCLNSTAGGDGAPDPDDETRMKLRRKKSPEAVENMRIAQLGKKKSPEEIERMRGRKLSPEHIESMRAAKRKPEYIERMRGRKLSPEHVESIRAANRERFRPEHIDRLRAANLGRKLSPEHIEKIRAAKIGKKCSPETIAKIRATTRGRKQRPEHTEAVRAAKAKVRAARLGPLP